jgi:hypothetical protein
MTTMMPRARGGRPERAAALDGAEAANRARVVFAAKSRELN